MVYGIAVNTHFAKEYIKHNQDSNFVIYSGIIFGVRKRDSYGDKYEDFFRMCIYYFTLISCIVLAQMWKQAKWLDIRDKLRGIPEETLSKDSYSFTRLIYYLENRDTLKSKLESLRVMVKGRNKK